MPDSSVTSTIAFRLAVHGQTLAKFGMYLGVDFDATGMVKLRHLPPLTDIPLVDELAMIRFAKVQLTASVDLVR